MEPHEKVRIEKIPEGGPFVDIDSRAKGPSVHGVKHHVFKVDQDIISDLEANPDRAKQISDRVKDTTNVYLLTLDQEFMGYTVYKISEGTLQACEDNYNLVRKIRHADFMDMLIQQDSGCLHIAEPGTHYRTPSGMHTKAFLRLADAIHSFDRLDRISYWLLEELSNAKAVLIDNWSLSSAVLHAQIVMNKPIKFDCLRQHLNAGDERSEAVARTLFRDLNSGDEVFLLVSVNASGSHLTSIANLCKRIRPDLKFTSASVYQMPCNREIDRPDKVFCEISESGVVSDTELRDLNEITSYKEDACPYCKADNESILDIDERYYYPRQHNETLVTLPARLVNENSELRPHLDMLGRIDGVFCVHRDDPNGVGSPRHHAFYVDVKKLIEHDDFVTLFEEELDQLKCKYGYPDVIIYPPHSAAKSLFKVAFRMLDCKSISSHDLKDLNTKDKQLLKSCEHICILDDVIITGGRIDRYVRTIREDIRPPEGTLKTLSIVIAVQRTESEQQIKTLMANSLSSKNGWISQIFAAAKLYLPNWDEKLCPWCQEEDMWAQANAPFDDLRYHSARVSLLNSKSVLGITDKVFPRFLPDEVFSLGSSSPLSDEGTSEMHILFVIAVALQMMRFGFEERTALRRGFSKNTALSCGDKEDSVFIRYSEPLIQACLLRCAQPNEWSSEILDIGIPKIISNLDGDNAHMLSLETVFFLRRRPHGKLIKREVLTKLRQLILDYVEDKSNDPTLSILDSLINDSG